MPVTQPTSSVFGGSDLKTLYISSVFLGMNAEQRAAFLFSSRRRHTRYWRDWSQTCALPIYTLACNDDVSFPSNETSIITMHVNAGTTYYVRVSGYNGAKGDIVLNVGSCHACPADFNQNGTLEVQD